MNKIKVLRESKGLTQQNLADHLGLGRSTVAMYETDKSEPDFSTLIKLSALFGVTIDEIVGNMTNGKDNSRRVSQPYEFDFEGTHNADAGDYTKARSVNDFSNKAAILAALKEIIILPKSKESLILQILEDDERTCGWKYELLATFDRLDFRRQCEVLNYSKELLQPDPTLKTLKPASRHSAAGAAENGVVSVYRNKDNQGGGKK